MHTNLLYISMSRRERILGWLLLPVSLAVPLALVRVLPNAAASMHIFLYAAILLVSLFSALRRFLLQTIRDIPGRWKHILLRAALGYVLCVVVTTVLNDLFYCFMSEYYYYTETGPKFLSPIHLYFLTAAQEHSWLTFLSVVILLPIVQELLYRGVVFGSLYPLSTFLACVVSVTLYCLFQAVLFSGMVDTIHLVLTALQYLPAGLFLIWLYTSTDSIVTPILMQMLTNLLLLT